MICRKESGIGQKKDDGKVKEDEIVTKDGQQLLSDNNDWDKLLKKKKIVNKNVSMTNLKPLTSMMMMMDMGRASFVVVRLDK